MPKPLLGLIWASSGRPGRPDRSCSMAPSSRPRWRHPARLQLQGHAGRPHHRLRGPQGQPAHRAHRGRAGGLRAGLRRGRHARRERRALLARDHRARHPRRLHTRATPRTATARRRRGRPNLDPSRPTPHERNTMANNPVVHFEIAGQDGPALRDFYSKLFGWQFQLWEGGPDYGMIPAGRREERHRRRRGRHPARHEALRHLLHRGGGPAGQPGQGEGLGGKIVQPPTPIPGMGASAMFADPDGNLIGPVQGQRVNGEAGTPRGVPAAPRAPRRRPRERNDDAPALPRQAHRHAARLARGDDRGRQAAMGAHFVYLRTLTWEGKCLLAGPVFGAGGFGLVVLQTADEAEARAIMAAEPSVTGGVHTYTLNPMVASLMHGRQVFPARPGERAIVREAEVPTTRAAAWRAWTTEDGLRSFFAERSRGTAPGRSLRDPLFRGRPRGRVGRGRLHGAGLRARAPARRELEFTA